MNFSVLLPLFFLIQAELELMQLLEIVMEGHR